MRYRTATTVIFLLAFIGCAQRAPQSNPAEDQTNQASVPESTPDDDLHGNLNSMPSDDTHAKAMAEMTENRKGPKLRASSGAAAASSNMSGMR